MRKMGIALLAPALVLAGTGCATKEFVREQVSQTQARMDEQVGEQGRRIDVEARRIDEQATKVGAQAKQIDAMGPRFTKIETSVDEFGNIARSAQTKAEEASTKANDVDGRLTKLWSTRSQRQVVETINVQFGFDKAELTDAAQTALSALIKELTDNPELTVDLEGYTDASGPSIHNERLSERRVAAVRRFLVQHAIDLGRINWIGMGELAEGDKAQNRRVTVRMMLPAGDLPAQSRAKAQPEEMMPLETPPSESAATESDTTTESKR